LVKEKEEKEKEEEKVMDFIPTFHFVSALAIFGLLFYVYNPIVIYLRDTMGATGVYADAMLWIWGLLALINLLISGVRLVMKMQERRGY
jgi:hypothetical protein